MCSSGSYSSSGGGDSGDNSGGGGNWAATGGQLGDFVDRHALCVRQGADVFFIWGRAEVIGEALVRPSMVLWDCPVQLWLVAASIAMHPGQSPTACNGTLGPWSCHFGGPIV